MKQPLTKRQREILNFLIAFNKKHGYMPTHLEIAKKFGTSAGGTTTDHLVNLENKGWIKRKKYYARWILAFDEKGRKLIKRNKNE